MPRDAVFVVTKVFAQSPHYIIATSKIFDGIFSLPPHVPIIGVREPKPTEEEVNEFLGIKSKPSAAGFKLLWNGLTPLPKLMPEAVGILVMLKALGKKYVSVDDLQMLINRHLAKFCKNFHYLPIETFMLCEREMISTGLIEEVLSPVAPLAIREANIESHRMSLEDKP